MVWSVTIRVLMLERRLVRATLSVISGHIYVWVQTTKQPFGPSCVS